MKQLKVLTVLGTRPEIIRLSRVIHKLDQTTHHLLVHTGQNYDYELNEVFFRDLAIRKPDIFLNSAHSCASPASTIANIISSVDEVFRLHQPDALLVLGDTNSCLSVIPAKKRQIPIFHMEAGNRCFDLRVPEETNRRIVDHTADVNLPYSSIARDYLLREGLPPDLVIKTGSPMQEVLFHYYPKILESTVLSDLHLTQNKYFLLSSHREENIEPEASFHKLISIINMIPETYNMPLIISLHPRTQRRLAEASVTLNTDVRLLKPLGFFDYINLQVNARVVLSDSGTITEESSILNFPALNLRSAHERPEGMEEATVIMTGLDVHRVQQSIELVSTQSRGPNRDLRLVADYDIPNVSDKIVRLIYSYTDYVNRVIWEKY